MSISDTNQAKKYAAIAEVAAAQCKLLTEEASKAPEYTNQAKQYAESAEASSASANIASQQAVNSANGASQSAIAAQASAGEASASQQSVQNSEDAASASATSALNSANDAEASAASAAASVSNTLRVSDGPVAPLPNAATRANKVLTCDDSGNFQFTVPSSGSAADVLNDLADPTGSSLVGTSSGKTVQQFVDVTENVVGTNNYSNLPAIGSSITSGSDYLYNGVLYTTVGESGVIQSITGNVVLTNNGNAYLLDKRWPVNDVRAWGGRDDVQADLNFKNAITYINKAAGGIRTVYVPPIALLLKGIELRDLKNLTIHFDGTFIIGNSDSTIKAMIDIVNARALSVTGSWLASGNSFYTYAIRGRAGLPSVIAPDTGIFTNVDFSGAWKFDYWNCAMAFGDGGDQQVSEINIGLINTNHVNCCVEVNGSQAIVSVSGSCVCEPVSGYSYKKGVFNIIGGVINHTSGEAVSSIDASAPVVNISQVSSAQYLNPFGSARLNGVHVETVSSLVSIKNSSGITGSSFSGHSDITLSMCSGSMLNGGIPLIENQVADYIGTVNIADTCNFYSSVSRTSVIVYSTSANMTARIGDSAFRDGFTTISENISPQCNWQHGIRPIAYLEAASVSIPSNTDVGISFPSRLSSGDYKYYYANTNADGFNVATHLRQMEISVYMPSSGAEFRVSVILNGVEYFSCISGGTVTIPGNKLPIGAEIRFSCRNTSGSTATLANTARVAVMASNF